MKQSEKLGALKLLCGLLEKGKITEKDFISYVFKIVGSERVNKITKLK